MAVHALAKPGSTLDSSERHDNVNEKDVGISESSLATAHVNYPEITDANGSRRTGSIITLVGSALANFSDGYQQNLSNLTNAVFGGLLGNKIYDATAKTRISNALLIGNIVGIIIFGYVADRFTRRQGMFITSSLVVVGTLMCIFALNFDLPSAAHGMLWYMVVARGIAGVGVGGEYPAASPALIEAADESFTAHRGPIQILSTSFMAVFAGSICVFIYLMSLIGSGNNLTVAYHAIYAIAIFLPVIVMLVRLGMQDARMFEKSNFRRRPIPWWLLLKTYWRRILGVSVAFFFYDFVNFPNANLSTVIISSLVPDKAVRSTAIWQLILSILPVPGPLIGAWLCNRIGRRYTGILGLVVGYIIIGCIIGGLYDTLSTRALPAFIVLYGLLQFLGHMGPASALSVISVEAFPTAARAMCYGITAAVGKAGAAIGVQVFLPIREAAGPSSTFYVAAGVGALLVGVFYLLPEGLRVDLEKEDAEFEALLAASQGEPMS